MRDATHYCAMAGNRGIGVPDERLAEFAAASLATVPLDAKAKTGAETVEVRAEHGRWIVDCPDCGGALLAHPADPRFLCADCGNVGVGGKYRRVVWPKDHAAIGDLLDARTDRRLRNWLPGESVKQIREENDLLAQAPVLIEPAGWLDPKWAGHTHAYPKKLPDGEVVSCNECGHPFPVELVAAERDAARETRQP